MKYTPSTNTGNMSILFLFLTTVFIMANSNVLAFTCQPFEPRQIMNIPSSKSTALFYDDSSGESEQSPFQLSDSDFHRLKEHRQRRITIPILILEQAMLPKQSMMLTSGRDPNLQKMIEYVLEQADHDEVGIIGFNPYSNVPMNIGVTVSIKREDVSMRNIIHGMCVQITGDRRFEIEEEPFVHESGSFYMASVEITEEREEIMSEAQLEETEKLASTLPALVDKWCELVYTKGLKDEVKNVLMSLGPMPKNVKKRALWVGSLLNPLPSLKLCSEIRPAMLACRNNYERMKLSVIAIQSSIHSLSGKAGTN